MNTCSQLILSANLETINMCLWRRQFDAFKERDVLSTNKYANIAAWLMLV